MASLRIVQITDTHLSPRHQNATDRFDAIVREVNLDPPDLVVNTGDIVLEDPDDVVDRDFARSLHRGFTAPVVAIPGNHDIGESGWTPWNGPLITEARRQAFAAIWGGDRFVFDHDGWRLIGVNAQLISGPLAEAEAEHDEWLTRALRGADHVALFVHKPVRLHTHDEPGLSLESPGRERLLASLTAAPVRLVASGHLHRYRVAFDHHYGWLEVWGPSSVYANDIGPDGSQPISGYLEYVLEPDGRVEVRLIEP